MCPVRVQGEGAAEEIAAGIDTFNREFPVDVLIVGRGGGSIEDLWAFNEEAVVRAVYRSRIPIISAVGHEIDITLSDLVADVRAPTPSAAAEMVAQHKEALESHLGDLYQRLQGRFRQTLALGRERLLARKERLRHPSARITDLRLRLDEEMQRLEYAVRLLLNNKQQGFFRGRDHLFHLSPERELNQARFSVNQAWRDLGLFFRQLLDRNRQSLQRSLTRLDGLSPLGILARGYSITTTGPGGEVVRRAKQVRVDDMVQVRLHQGSLRCRVTSKQK
jgi:exodeoxyribonuclease VII large subunit